jgi:putative PEP-CTERM system TPR-repeat lipoprotein
MPTIAKPGLSNAVATRPWWRPRLAGIALLAALLLAAGPADASMERARAAQARGDLRAAQIEFRNAVRTDPNSAAARAALAQASLDVGDTDTAEKEAQAALERGFDRAAGTALLIRAYLGRGRFQEILRDFPVPDAQVPPAVAAQILTGRGLALLGLDRRDEARTAIAEAVRLSPQAAAPQIATAQLALAEGNRTEAEAALDRALAAEAANVEALLRKGTLQFERGDFRGAVDTFGRLLATMPGNVIARNRRADAYIRLGQDAEALREVEAALRTAPGHVPSSYMRAMLHARAQEWRQADEILQRLGGSVANFPEGLLLQAGVKQALGQTEQAEDAARRYVARRPEDPRGAKLLAGIEMAAGRPDAAAGTLTRLVQRGAADPEAFDMLGRAHLAMGRPREAAEAFQQAAARVENNAGLQARLATARLAAGDADGAAAAARRVLELDPTQAGMHQILAGAALARGDLATATAELEKVPPAARDTELSGIIEGTIRLVRVDLPGARTVFETVLRNHPNSVRARLGLARVAAMQGQGEEVDRLFAEVLAREPGNVEAATRLAAAARSGTPRAAPARAVLERAQAAAPADPRLAVTTAGMLIALGEPAKAAEILDAPALRATRRGTPVLQLLAEARAAQGQWAEAEAASRAALAEEPDNVNARQQLAALTLRNGNPRGAETLLNVGLNAQPGSMVLLQAMVQLVRQDRGLDAALEAADRLSRMPGTRPASLVLRGDLLMGAERPEEAAQAYARGFAEMPSQLLALRQSTAWQVARKPEEAARVLETWLAREPGDVVAASQLAQIEIATGRTAEAERRLTGIVAANSDDWVSLNNLAWLMQGRSDPATAAGKATLAEARLLAERAYYISPSPETSDTLGWILAREGQTAAALPLLQQAAAASVARQRPDPAMFYRLAYALRAAGQREEALRILEPVMAADVQFAEREEAARLLAALRSGG